MSEEVKELLKRQDKKGSVKELVVEYGTQSFDEIERQLYEEVINSRKLSKQNRQERLKIANKIPMVTTINIKTYKRNPDVVVAALERAEGICERCGADAPFIRVSDGIPYLEVHHKKRLADGGEDTVDNTIAVCQNCHKELHYGI